MKRHTYNKINKRALVVFAFVTILVSVVVVVNEWIYPLFETCPPYYYCDVVHPMNTTTTSSSSSYQFLIPPPPPPLKKRCPFSDEVLNVYEPDNQEGGVEETVVRQLEAFQGGPVLLDLNYGNTTPPCMHNSSSTMPTNLRVAPQTVAALKSSIRCFEVRGLPPGADGRWLFNLALSPGQAPARSIFLATEPMAVHIYDEAISEEGKRSSGDYGVVLQETGSEDFLPDVELYDDSAKRKYNGRYGFSSSKVIGDGGGAQEVLSMEVYAGLARWSTYRTLHRGERGMRSIFSSTYISYVSITHYKPRKAAAIDDRSTTIDSSTHDPVFRWHPLGALPPVSLVTQAAYKLFRDSYFEGRDYEKEEPREGLEDCIFIPPFDNITSHNTMDISSQRRRFVICSFGFTFKDGQMFIGEVTSRFEKGCIKNRVSVFDNEWIPVMDDPEGFGVDLETKNEKLAMNKNWNVVPCDHIAIRGDQQHQQRTSITHALGWVICLQTSVAPSVKTVAFDMDSRKVVASWESKNEAQNTDKLRNGKGVIPLLPHEIPHASQPSKDVALALPPQLPNNTSAVNEINTSLQIGNFPKSLALFHINENGDYRLVWGLIDNRAPFAITKNGNPSDTPSFTPFRPWKRGNSKVEYVRSITLSQNRENVFFSYSLSDNKGQMCTVPLGRAVQASIGNLI